MLPCLFSPPRITTLQFQDKMMLIISFYSPEMIHQDQTSQVGKVHEAVPVPRGLGKVPVAVLVPRTTPLITLI